MADYCNILRSHVPTDPLAVEVYRPDTQQVFEGTLNGNPLQVTTTFATEVGDDVQDTPGSGTYDNYVEVTDDSGVLSMSVPAEWSDVSGVPWNYDGETVGYSIVAAPNIQGWYDTWDVPGVFFGASQTLRAQVSPTQLLDQGPYDFSSSCTYDGRYDYEDPLYVGKYDLWLDCGGSGALLIVLAAEPFDQSSIILLQATAIYDEDLDAVDTVLNSFVAGF